MFISLSLLMMLTTGCQEIKLKAGIEAANKQCPIDMGETGKITSIVYDGENVVYTFYLNEEAANIKTLQKNPESMKTSLKIMFQNPNKEVKSLLDLVVKCKAGLQMIYICPISVDFPSSTLPHVINLSNPLILEVSLPLSTLHAACCLVVNNSGGSL